MESFFHNDLLVKKIVIGENILKVISLLNINSNSDLKAFIKNFINLKTFPYINTQYGDLIEDYFDELDDEQKLEVIGQLESLLEEIDQHKKSKLKNLTQKEIEQKFSLEIAEENNFDDIYSHIKGGEYGEMFINEILLKIGYEKIMSKLYIEWGNLSPTGIDVPYINLENKVIVLGEVKFYKDIYSAFKSLKMDIDAILNSQKFDKELKQWKRKVKMMPEKIRRWYMQIEDDKKINKEFYCNEYKIIVLGAVLGNSKEHKDIIKKFDEIFGDNKVNNYEVIILTIPVESKDEFIKQCSESIRDILNEVRFNNG